MGACGSLQIETLPPNTTIYTSVQITHEKSSVLSNFKTEGKDQDDNNVNEIDNIENDTEVEGLTKNQDNSNKMGVDENIATENESESPNELSEGEIFIIIKFLDENLKNENEKQDSSIDWDNHDNDENWPDIDLDDSNNDDIILPPNKIEIKGEKCWKCQCGTVNS